MVATVQIKVYTGTSAGTESSGDAGNLNLLSADSFDSTGLLYQSNRISVPSSGTNYSYEKWVRLKFSGSFTAITNCKVYKSAGTLSDSNLVLKGGVTTSGATPVNTVSSVATTASSSWDSLAEALDIQNGTMTADPSYTKYFVMQLSVPSTVTTPGDIGTQTITFQWDES